MNHPILRAANCQHSWMAILNLSKDSFSGDGRDRESFLRRLDELAQTEVNIVDFGAVSTKPGSPEIDFATEWGLIEPVLDDLLSFKKRAAQNGKRVTLSLDTSSPRIAAAVCERIPLDCINDIYAGQKIASGLTTFDVASRSNTSVVVMHMQNTPANMQLAPTYTNCVKEVADFLCKRAAQALQKDVKNVIVDPGIGFGKSLADNLELLQRESLEYIKNEINRTLGKTLPLLVGLSRKRFILELCRKDFPNDQEKIEFLEKPQNRDLESKIWEYKCIEWGAEIIRTHKMPCEVRDGT